MSRTIYVTQGEVAYVGGVVTEKGGKDISADSIVVALGEYDPPPPFASGVSAEIDIEGAAPASRVVKFRIDSSTTPRFGAYLWAWIADNPEITPVRLDGPFIIV